MLAERRPKTEDDLGRHVRLRSTMIRRHGEHLLAAIQAAKTDTDPLPKAPHPKKDPGPRAPYRGREVDRMLADLKRWRTEVVDVRGVPVALVASNNQLKNLAAWRPKTLEALAAVPEVRNWQIARYGEEWLAFIARFEAGLPQRSASDDAPKAAKSRRRRRRRRSGDDAPGAAGSPDTPAE